MNKTMKVLMIGLIVMYAVMPDPIPGPVDDILLAVLGYVVNKKLSAY